MPEGPLAEEFVDYLLSIRPANPGNIYIRIAPGYTAPTLDKGYGLHVPIFAANDQESVALNYVVRRDALVSDADARRTQVLRVRADNRAARHTRSMTSSIDDPSLMRFLRKAGKSGGWRSMEVRKELQCDPSD